MAWLAQSFADSLRLDDDEEAEEEDEDGEERGERKNKNVFVSTETLTSNDNANPKPRLSRIEDEEDDLTEIPLSSASTTTEELQSRGVKEDLTELKQTLTRQFWGVASFLAPPPPPSDPSMPSHPDPNQLIEWDPREEVPELERIGSDREEEEEEEEEFDPVGVTDEVLAFARNIAMHPETWLDFPLDPEDDLNGYAICYAFTADDYISKSIGYYLPKNNADVCAKGFMQPVYEVASR